MRDRGETLQDAGPPVWTPTPSGRFPRWFCVAANYGQDGLARASIAADGWQVLLPLHAEKPRRIRGTVTHPIVSLFPGYLFVRFCRDSDPWGRLCSRRGVYRVLGRPGRPTPLPGGDIEGLAARMDPAGLVRPIAADDEQLFVKAGDTVRILEGPFATFLGVCQMAEFDRVKVLLDIMGRATRFEMSVASVEVV